MAINNKPTLAQLVERRTVVVADKSLGHWFESGRSDKFFSLKKNCGRQILSMEYIIFRLSISMRNSNNIIQ